MSVGAQPELLAKFCLKPTKGLCPEKAKEGALALYVLSAHYAR